MGRGDYVVERRGFEDPAREIKSLCNIGQKRNEKKRKEKTYHIFTCVPANEAMAAAGLARFEGRRTVERWGLRTRMWGKEVSATLVRKETKKRRKTYLYLHARE